MTGPTSANFPGSPDVPAALSYDPVLAELVQVVNSLRTSEVGVTLEVRGLVVSGVLISAEQFFHLQIKALEDPAVGAAANALAPFFQPWLEANRADAAHYEEDESFDLPDPVHVHMRRASILNSGAHSLTIPLWRGRLAEVSGWSIGSFGMVPPLDDQ